MEKLTLLAVGGAGCRIIREVAALAGPDARLRLLATDTDAEALSASGVPEENRLLAGEIWRGGRGCGGSVIDGQRAFAHERARLEKLLTGSGMALVIAGLGGGSGSGGAPIVQSVLTKLRIPAVFLLALPFSMEGHSRRRIAEKVITEELIESAGAVIPLPNDLLFSTLEPETPLAEAFRLADSQTAHAALALTVLLNSGNLLAADFAALSALLRRRRSSCGIGVGTAKSGDPESLHALIEGVLDSPLLGGAGRLGEADAVVVALNGPGLTLGEAREIFETLGKYLPAGAETICGAGDVETWGKVLQLTVVTVKFADLAEPAPAEKGLETRRNPESVRPHAAPESDSMVQQTLPFADPGSGTGIMERTTPVIVNGENLDIPTFIRRRVAVDDGKGSWNYSSGN